MFEEFKGTGIPIPTPKKPSRDFLKKLPKIVLIVVIVLVLLAVVASSWYTVNDKEQAVVTTFGKVTDITDAGFHFKLPFGIQKVEKVNVNVYQKLELGYRSVGSADNFDIIESETKMITGDYNIVDVEFFVEYKVSDPEKYLYGSYDPETILRNLLQSWLRSRGRRFDDRQGIHSDACQRACIRNFAGIRHRFDACRRKNSGLRPTDR